MLAGQVCTYGAVWLFPITAVWETRFEGVMHLMRTFSEATGRKGVVCTLAIFAASMLVSTNYMYKHTKF